jgi:hypothetical protein
LLWFRDCFHFAASEDEWLPAALEAPAQYDRH